MPNGRSGGFLIRREQLETLLRALPSETVIGTAIGTTVTVGQALILVAKHPQEQIAIEEQDHTWYIIRLSTWISADATTEIYSHLRECHAQWLEKLPRPDNTDESAGKKITIPATPRLDVAEHEDRMANPLPLRDETIQYVVADLGIKAEPNEELVALREDYPLREGEIAAVTTLRFIALGTSWPGPNFFGYSVPIENWRRIEYQRHSHWVLFLLGCIMVLTGIGGLVWSYRAGAPWFMFVLFLLLVLTGLPRLFRLRSAEILFHCEKETLKWSFVSGASHDIESVASKILPFAGRRGIVISNFSNAI